ncbi:ABC transporter substrate-binding protein [Streptomyces sp. NPDC088788]|uniref:ABC transporter substrate-binding protein n=1 Tax=Streptomyces sp. NPDC088788 TaxID=3365898 RepID=UPI0037FCB641
MPENRKIMMKKITRQSPLPISSTFILLLVAACSAGGNGWSDESSEVTVATADPVLSIDPASGYDPGSWVLFNNVFQSLLSFPKGSSEPEPDAAKKCAFIDDKVQTYKCTLRDDVKFSNGDSLTASDVKFSFDRTLAIDDVNGPAVMLQTLERVEAVSARTVVFHLKTPDATFPSKIASGAGSIVDHREYKSNALRNDGRAIGSGPYNLQSFSNRKAKFTVNENYHGSAQVKNSGVTLRFVDQGQKLLKEQLAAKKIDIAYRAFDARSVSDFNDQEGLNNRVQVVEGDSAEVQHLVFNMKNSIAGRLSVRKAIAFLLDRDSLVQKIYQNTAIPLYSVIPAGVTGHRTSFFNIYGARPSLIKATNTLRADGISSKVKLTLWSTPSRYGPATDQEMRAIAEELNSSKLFEATVKSIPFNDYSEDVTAGKYGVYVKGWIPDYPDPDNFTAPFFGKKNVLENNYSNKAINTLIPQTAAITVRKNASEKFGELQDIAAKELPVIPIWQGKQYAVVQEDVRGYQYCLDSSTIFRFWELFKVKS